MEEAAPVPPPKVSRRAANLDTCGGSCCDKMSDASSLALQLPLHWRSVSAKNAPCESVEY